MINQLTLNKEFSSYTNIALSIDHRLILTNWVKLDLYFLGKSKKHYIFRARQWNNKLENLMKRPIYNEQYEKIGTLKDIFGPISHPFISVKPMSEQELVITSESSFYAKI